MNRTSTVGNATETPVTPADLQALQAELDRLDAVIRSNRDALTTARARVQRAALIAGRALEQYSLARRAWDVARQDDLREQTLLAEAQQAVSSSRRQIGRWARQSYATGVDASALVGLGAGGGDRLIGVDDGGQAGLVTALQLQTEAAGRTALAAQQAQAAQTAAALAKAEADAAVKQQRTTLAQVERTLAAARSAAARQRDRIASAKRSAQTATRAVAATPAVPVRLSTPVGRCAGEDLIAFSNGEIPLAALCPLAADPNQHLRADAAYAFDRLSRAYTARFGTPPCITDSYRTLAEQVRLYATKPNLAAHPGTSNHGWGTALDLCGGIQDFGTAQHEWMFLNAPLFGWFHPAWAQPGGSRPEPWHFEFGG